MVALLFFVVMAVIGSVILAAASSSAGRIKGEDQGDQERYALYSAANLVVDAFSSQKQDSIKIDGPSVTYYVENDTGELYRDAGLTNKVDSTFESQKWNEGDGYKPDTSSASHGASDLIGIRNQIVENALGKNWNTVLNNWNTGTDLPWNSLFSDSTDKTVKYQFRLTGEDSWSKDADAFREVDVELTVHENLDITGVFSIHQDDEKLKKEVIGDKYYIRIPLSASARVSYKAEAPSDSAAGNQTATDDSASNQEKSYTEKTEKQSIQLNNFFWDKDQAIISTRKSEIDGDQK